MISQMRALAWEFLRQALWPRVFAVTGFVCMMKFFHKVIVWQGGGYVDATQADGSLNVFFVLAPFAYVMLPVYPVVERKPGCGIPRRLYALPIPTWFLTGWLMFLGMVANALAMLAMIGLFYVWTGISLLMWGPVVFAAAVAAWGLAQATLRAAAGSVTLWLTSLAAGMGLLLVWSGTRFAGGNMSWGGPPWTYPTASEWLLMSACVAAAYLFAWYGVSRDRRGDVRSRLIEVEWWEQWRGGRLARLENSYFSPEAWYTWKVWHWVLSALMFILIGLIVVLGVLDDPVEALEVIAPLGIFFLTLGAFLFGTLITLSIVFDRRKQIPLFLSTKPIADRSLAFSTLKTAGLHCFLTWTTYIPAFLGLHYLVWMRGDLAGLNTFSSWLFVDADGFSLRNIVMFVGLSLVVGWTSTGIGVSLTLIGRPIVFIAIFVAYLTYVFGVPVCVVFGFDGFLGWVESAGPWLVFALCVGGTAWLFIGARRLGFIGTKAAGLAFLWLVFVSFMVVNEFSTSPWNPALRELLYLAGLWTLPITPFAAAPLALYWNRHR